MDGDANSPHSCALRKGRHSLPLHIYLITTVTRDRSPVFKDIWIGRLLVNSLKKYQTSSETLSFVVMPDHLHWLFKLQPGCTLSYVVGRVKRDSAKMINHALQRQGPVWQDGFHDRGLRSDEDVRAVARYIIANPLRAGLVDQIGDYPLWDAIWL